MARISYKNQCLQHYQQKTQDVQNYYGNLPTLLQHLDFSVTLAYMFSQLELGHRWLLYLGLVRLHKLNRNASWEAIHETYLNKDDFQRFFLIVFGQRIPKATIQIWENAAGIRNRVMHGRNKPTLSELKTAIEQVLDYSEEMNRFVGRISPVRPFVPDRRGLLAGQKAHLENTSKWVLKGMGFTSSPRNGI